MDELLREFVTETNESLDVVDVELVRFEQDPNNAKILDNIFRLVHTIKGTCGFLGFHRLEAVAHSGEGVLSALRDETLTWSPAIAGALLAMVDAVRAILRRIEATGEEGTEAYPRVIAALERIRPAAGGRAARSATAPTPAASAPVGRSSDVASAPASAPVGRSSDAASEPASAPPGPAQPAVTSSAQPATAVTRTGVDWIAQGPLVWILHARVRRTSHACVQLDYEAEDAAVAGR